MLTTMGVASKTDVQSELQSQPDISAKEGARNPPAFGGQPYSVNNAPTFGGYNPYGGYGGGQPSYGGAMLGNHPGYSQ